MPDWVLTYLHHRNCLLQTLYKVKKWWAANYETRTSDASLFFSLLTFPEVFFSLHYKSVYATEMPLIIQYLYSDLDRQNYSVEFLTSYLQYYSSGLPLSPATTALTWAEWAMYKPFTLSLLVFQLFQLVFAPTTMACLQGAYFLPCQGGMKEYSTDKSDPSMVGSPYGKAAL